MFWDELLPCLFSLPTFASLPTMHSGISRAALKATCCCLQDDAQGARLSLSLCGSPVPLEGECGAVSTQDPLLLLLWVRAALPSTKRWGEAPDGSCAVQVAEPDLVKACSGADILLFVVPHQFIGKVCDQIKAHVKKGAIGMSLIKV